MYGGGREISEGQSGGWPGKAGEGEPFDHAAGLSPGKGEREGKEDLGGEEPPSAAQFQEMFGQTPGEPSGQSCPVQELASPPPAAGGLSRPLSWLPLLR